VTVSDDDLLRVFDDLQIDHDNKAHYAGWLEKKLLINRCDACGRLHHPPLSMCPECWSTAVTPEAVSGSGTVYLKVALYQGPVIPEVAYAEPHVLVTVDLVEQNGVRFTSSFRGDGTSVEIGSPVHLAWGTRRGSPYPVWEAGPG
jgi:uncharacterized OB-fold protein